MNLIKILTTAGLAGRYSQAEAGSFTATANQKSFESNTVIVHKKIRSLWIM